MRKMIKKRLPILFYCMASSSISVLHFPLLAQGNVPYVEVPPFLSPNAERVGSVPLPTPQTIENTINPQPTPTVAIPASDIPIRSRKVEPDLKKNMFETTYIPGRMVFLNGININSIRNQDLENVNLKIDNNGNIYIESPQYEVTAEERFHPLLPQEIPKFPKQLAPTPPPANTTTPVADAATNLPPLPAKGEVYSKSTGQQVDPQAGSKGTMP
jgi:hypothetical protein